jgi:hypothetical protein
VLEELDGSLVFLCCLSTLERTEIAPFASFAIDFP